MRISNIQSMSFGKRAVLSCYVKKGEGKEKTPAILYEMDTKDLNDREEVLSSSYSYGLAPYFKHPVPGHRVYVLRDEKNDEIINTAKTSKHYSFIGKDKEGVVTVIDEFNANPDYINGAEATIAYITKEAGDGFNTAVISAIRPEDMTSVDLKRYSFAETKNGDWVLPEKRFVNFTDRAEKKSRIIYLEA